MSEVEAEHPGVHLKRLMQQYQLSGRRLHQLLHIPQMRISKILAERRRVSADTALRFGRFFGPDAEYWLMLQAKHDLAKLKTKRYTVERGIGRAGEL